MVYFGGGGGASASGNTDFTGTNSFLDGNKFSIKNQAAPTKIIQFSAASITAGQTRTITVPDVSATMAVTGGLASQTFSITDMVFNTRLRFPDGWQMDFGTGGAGVLSDIQLNQNITPNALLVTPGSRANSIHICETADIGFDFTNGPGGSSACTDPTLIIHSHNQSTSQWIAAYHDGTDGFIGTGAGALSINSASGVKLVRTITAGGTTGNQTINKMAGTVNFAAGASSITVTNSLVDTSSIILGVIRTADATATFIKSIVPGSGSFVITLNAAATAETSVGFVVTN